MLAIEKPSAGDVQIPSRRQGLRWPLARETEQKTRGDFKTDESAESTASVRCGVWPHMPAASPKAGGKKS